jgi:amino acid adenylation domain-containing protein
MKHRQLVPSLHSSVLNPNIDFDGTPFVVQQELAPWPRPTRETDGLQTEGARIAGISSFGAGGANAHVVIEEYLPSASISLDSNAPVMVVLSARDDDRLRERVQALWEHLGSGDRESTISLPDLAFTLQVGREAMEERLALVVHSADELREKLGAYLAGEAAIDELYRGQVKRNKEALAGLAGDADMAATVDAWIVKGKYGKLLELWVRGLHVDWQRLYGEVRLRRISLPTYPFARERYWVPVSFTPSNASHDSGAFLHPLVHRNTSTFSVQRFSSHFSGEEFFLADHVARGLRILPGVAQLEMAHRGTCEAIEAAGPLMLKGIVWMRPAIVGTDGIDLHIALMPQENGDIRFEIYRDTDEGDDDGIVTYSHGTVVSLASEGPDETFTQNLAAIRADCTVSHLSAVQCYALFDDMGLRYGAGFRGLSELFVGTQRVLARITLPASLQLDGYTLHPALLDAALQAAVGLGHGVADEGHSTLWLPATLGSLEVLAPCAVTMWAVVTHSASTPSDDTSRWIDVDLCDDTGTVCVRFRQLELRASAVVADADTVVQTLLARPVWELLPVMDEQAVARVTRRHLLLLCGIDGSTTEAVRAKWPRATCIGIAVGEDIAQVYELAAATLLEQIQSQGSQPGQFLVQLVVPAQGIGQTLVGLGGMLRTAGLENPAIMGQVISVEAGQDIVQTLVENHDSAATQIRYVHGARQVGGWVESLQPSIGVLPAWKAGATYLITGGAGGLGLIFARDIARHAPGATLVLTGRSSLTGAMQARFAELEALGAVLHYLQLDVSDRDAVRQCFQDTAATHGLHGIIHSAGVLRDSFIIRKTREELHEVLRAKVAGTLNLDDASQGMTLDCFLCFSSISGALGNVGQADYAAANGFMDAFAHYRSELVAQGLRHGHTLSVNWPLWEEGGMQVDAGTRRYMLQETGMAPLRSGSGCAALAQAMASGLPQVLVAEGRMDQLKASLLTGASVASSHPPVEPDHVEAMPEDLRERTIRHLIHLLSATLKLPPHKIDADAALEAYGIDSVMVLDLTLKLEKSFGPLPKTLFFEYQNMGALAGYFLQTHRQRLVELLGDQTVAATPAVVARPGGHARAVSVVRQPSRFGSRAVDHSPGEIAIIGVAGRYPQAANLDEFWANLSQGRDSITEIPVERWDHTLYFDEDRNQPGKTYGKWGGFIDGVDLFDPMFFNISPREAELMDPQERLFLECVHATLEDAGYTRDNVAEDSDVGVFVGVMYEEYQLYGAQEQARGRFIAMPGSPASIANRISYFCNFNGPSLALDTMCSSSLTAIHLACQSLQRGDCAVAVAGGVNVSVHPNKYLMLAQGKFISGKGRCESFGEGGEGYVPGEGVGAVLLKPLAQAKADGDHIYGVIKATAVNHGGKTNGYTVPNPNAQAKVVERALRKSGIDARAVSYVEAHGTGTSLGDPIEIAGLTKAFRGWTQDTQFCAIGSAKSNIGHCESAAGIAGVTKVLLQMKHQQLVPSLHSRVLNPNIDFEGTPFVVQQELAPWPRPHQGSRIAGISSFGAGGANAHVLIEEYVATAATYSAEGPALIVLSARNEDRLQEQVRQLLTAITPGAEIALADLAYTLQVGRDAMDERLALRVRSVDELHGKLSAWLAGETNAGDLYHGQVKRNKDTLAIFTGDDDVVTIVEAWMAKGKFDKLLDGWVKGLSVDWQRLYGDKRPRRISLPTYPFARERYWVPTVAQAVAPGVALAVAEVMTGPIETLSWQPMWTAQDVTGLTGMDTGFASHVVLLAGLEPVDATRLEAQLPGTRCLVVAAEADLAKQYESAAAFLLEQIQSAIGRAGKQLIQVLVPREGSAQTLAGLGGMLRTAQVESPRIVGQVIAVEPGQDLVQAIRENRAVDVPQVRYVDRERQVMHWVELAGTNEATFPWKAHGVYLITGGVGGLGLIFAREIASRAKNPVLILTGRSPANEAIKARIRSLETLGAVVRYHAVDVADAVAISQLVLGIPEEFESLDGIIHSAGVIRDSFLVAKTPEELHEVFAAKVAGTLNLDDASRDVSLDCFICFSSIAAVLGSVGQADYAAANGFMDAFAHHRADRVRQGHRHGRTLSINWPLWDEGGMRVDAATRAMLAQHSGMHAMATDEGTLALGHVLATGANQALVVAGDATRLRMTMHGTPSATETNLPMSIEANSSVSAATLQASLKHDLVMLVSSLIKVKPEDMDGGTTFSEFGFDSVSLTEFSNALNQRYELRLAPTLFFEHPTLDELAEHLLREHRDLLADRFAVPVHVAGVLPGPAATPVRLGHVANEPIAIIGMSGQFPQARDIAAFWENLREGRDCISEIPTDRWDRRRTRITWGGFIDGVDEFDPLFFGISPKEAELMDPQQRLMMIHVWKALEDAGYAGPALSGSDTAIYVGTGATGYGTLVNRAGLGGEAYASTGGVPSVGPNRISYLLNWHGSSEPVETACSSSLVALRRGVMAIRNGDSSMAVVGGVNTIVTPEPHISFNKAGMLSEDGRCKTFSSEANGYVRGEGAAMLVLKRLSDAERDGDHIHGVILGVAENHGGHANSLTAPNPKAQAAVVRKAHEQAGIDPRSVTYIEAHGTGTPLGDPVEINGLKAAFQELYTKTPGPALTSPHCGLGSVKTNIGHLELAAGVAGVIKVLLQMRHRTLVRSLHSDSLNPYIDLTDSPFYVLQEARGWTALHDEQGRALPRRAGVSSFGFGGVNAHVVLEEYVPATVATPLPDGPAIVLLSARNETRLREQVQSLLAFVSSPQAVSNVPLHDLAYTLQVGREAMETRFGVIVSSMDELREKLASVVSGTTVDAQPTQSRLDELLDRWVRGGAVDWQTLYGTNRPRRVSLPTYPFARDRYWIHSGEPEAVLLDTARPVKAEREVFLMPSWDVVNPSLAMSLPAATDRLVILGGTFAQQEAVKALFATSAVLTLPTNARTSDIELSLGTHGEIDHLVWIPDASQREADHDDDGDFIARQEQGVVLGFRLVKALLALGFDKRPLTWSVFTQQTQTVHRGDAVAPAHAGVHGFVGSMAKEFPRWQCRLLDMPLDSPWPIEQMFRLPCDSQGGALAWRSGQWFRQTLSPVEMAPGTPAVPVYRQGGVYVVIGGAGGIGQAWTEHMLRTYQANIVWIGRRARDETIEKAQARLAAFGPMPLYIRADATDRRELERARDEVLARFPAIHGVMHAAIALLDKSLVQMDEDRLRAGLVAKVDVSVRMFQVFGDLPLDFMLFFSSLLSFIKAAGQSNYAAGCTFEDAYALHLAARVPYPVKVINWGYWGSVGAVASPRYRERMAQQGVGSIEAEEGMWAIESLLRAPMPQLGFLKLRPTTHAKGGVHELIGATQVRQSVARFASLATSVATHPSRMPMSVDAAQLAQDKRDIDRMSLAILRGELQVLGLAATTPPPGLRPGYARWLAHSLEWLAQADAENRGRGMPSLDQAWAEWNECKAVWVETANVRQAQVTLVDSMLRALPAILRGDVPATSVMFPGSSMHLVEGLYQGNPVADHFNDVLCDNVLAFVTARLQQDPEARIRILEIGAGTGGTSARLMARLTPYAGHVEEYCYTDLSRAFLLHAQSKYGPRYPYLAYQLLDIGSPLAGQAVEAGSYDLVIATNVLHATRDIRESLRNAKAILRSNGLLVLNELSSCELWAHLTFGLLDGWWLYEDEALRIPGCPSLAPSRWAAVLREEGYRHVTFPAASAHELGQQVIVAESDGLVLQRGVGGTVGGVAVGTDSAGVEVEGLPSPLKRLLQGGAAIISAVPAVPAVPGVLLEKCRMRIKALIGRALKMPLDSIDSGVGLERYGIDSILVLELTNTLRAAFEEIGLEDAVTTTLFFEHPTINALAEHFVATEAAAMTRWVGLDTARHPLLHRNTSDASGYRSSSQFHGDEFFLADHRVGGVRVLPGVAQLEMALAAAHEWRPSDGRLSLRDVVWARPVVASGSGVHVQLTLQPARDGAMHYEVLGDASDHGNVYGRGTVFASSEPDASDTDGSRHELGAIRAQCVMAHFDAAQCYAVFEQKGLHYGPAFRGLTDVYVGDGLVMAKIDLPSPVASSLTQYVLHPSLLDAALQASLGLQMTASGPDEIALALPFALKTLDVLSPCTSHMWAIVRYSAGSAAGDAVQKLDIDLCDETGTVCVRLKHFSLRVLHPKPTHGLTTDRTTPDMSDLTGITSSKPLREKSILQFRKLISRGLSLPLDAIQANIGFDEYGIDSILVMEMTNALREVFGVDNVSTTMFFEHRDIDSLVDHFIGTDAEALMRWTGVESAAALSSSVPSPVGEVFAVATVRMEDAAVVRVTATVASAPVVAARFDVAIVGLSGRYPGAANVNQFWDNLVEGRNTITEVPPERWEHSRFFDEQKNQPGKTYTKWAGLLDDVDSFDRLFFNITPREAQLMSPQERLFMQEVHASIEDAGYTSSHLAQSRKIGLFVGVTNEHYATGARFWSVANRISWLCNFQGPSLAVDTACSSSLTAVHLAVESLRSGDSEVAVAGGVNLIVAPTQLIDLASMNMLSGDDRCKSFAADGDGFVDSEAVGAIVLKPLHRAVADGDHIYGVIKGSAINSGGKTNSYMVPSPHLQAQLVNDALQRAGIDARSVSYVEAQGTGSNLGDPIEIAGLSRAFRHWTQDKQFCAIGSAKSNVGHSESASGFVGISKVLMQMKHQTLVPSLHAATTNPNIRFADTPFFVQQERMSWQRPMLDVDGQRHEFPRIAGVSSFGAGGANAHVVIEEYIAPAHVEAHAGRVGHGPGMIVLSARTPDRLQARVEQLLAAISPVTLPSDLTLANVAYTLQVGREAMEERLALLVDSLDELRLKLASVAGGGMDIEDVYRGQAKRNAFSLLSDDEDMQVAVQAWVGKGKFGKLLDLWVKGFAFDWNALYDAEGRMAAGAVRPQRISLPSYPFARERYWTDVRYPDLVAASVEPGPAEAQADDIRMGQAQAMTRIWQDLLGRPSVDLDDDFFELGGHSLLATQLVARMRAEFGVDVPVSVVFEAPTVTSLVERIRSIDPVSDTPPEQARPAVAEHIAQDAAYPLSFAQQRLWFLDQLEGHSPTYNIPAAVRLKGRLDVDALQGALNDVVDRHDALRATFESSDGTPVQRIAPRLDLVLVLHDLRSLSQKERDVKTRWLMLEEARTPFHLQSGPLVRGSLLQLAEGEHLLLLTMHHIVSDGWSMGIFVKELGTLYASRALGAPPSLSELPMRYVDFASWQRQWLSGDVLDRQLDYWKRQLAGSPSLLTLPTDRPRPPMQGQDGAALNYAIPADLAARLQQLSRKTQSTLFMTLCAAFNVLLARYSGQSDICVGTPIANRNRSEIEDIIGLFVNTLVLRTQVDLDRGFTDLLKQVRTHTLDAYTHQDVQFEQLVGAVQPERHTSYSPLFQVMLVLQNAPMNLALPGLQLELVPHECVSAKFDITLTLTEDKQGLHGSFEYNTDLFDASTIKRMAGHFTHLLQSIVEDPERAVGELAMLGKAERQQLVHTFNDTAKVYPNVRPDTQTLHQLFEAQVARAPARVAVVYEGDSLTYAELNARANQLARHLRSVGVGPDVLVGLCTERSLEMIVGLYGILKAGGAYVPLDPTYPTDRLATIVSDARPAAILTQQHLLGVVPAVAGVPVFSLDSDVEALSGYEAGNLRNATQPSNLAYVIYTSGSTGKPKGVGIDQQGIVNRLQWMQEAYPLTAADRVLQKTPFSFDVSVWEFFWPLIEGATLVVAKPGGHQDVAYLAGLIDAEGITTAHFVPPMLDVFLNELEAGSGGSLRQVMCSGQALPLELQQRFFATWDHVALHNLYGPTEASVDVTYWPCSKDSALTCVPIGMPIANIQIHILDESFNPVPVGVVGHLYIAGIGLARGYINRPELTAQTFIPNPFSASPGARMYLSGDLARYLPDGTIEYLGRSDHQVKIRGLRIELGEIESTLATLESVRDVVVLARPDERGVARLVAYLVPHDGQAVPQAAALRIALLQTLPDYMVPEYFVVLDAMPLTSNGKVDRKALPAPEMAHDEVGYIAPGTATEKAIAEVWAEVLKVERVGVTDDFFELGGHSLLATQLVSQLRKRSVTDLELRDLFSYPTLGTLAAFVDSSKASDLHPNLVPIRPNGTSNPLFLIHAIGGGVQYAFDLAQHLDADQPVYALTASGLADGETPHASMAELATVYLDAIRQVQPSGPYYLAGWSLGGMIAYDIAQRLLTAGKAVHFVGMIDTSSPSMRARLLAEHPIKSDECRALLTWITDVNHVADARLHPAFNELMALAGQGDIDAMFAVCKREALVPAHLDPGQVRRTLALYQASAKAADDYQAPPAKAPVTFFAADRGEGDDLTLGWSDLLGKHMRVSRIGGSHLSIVQPPYIEKLAREIAGRLHSHAPKIELSSVNQ